VADLTRGYWECTVLDRGEVFRQEIYREPGCLFTTCVGLESVEILPDEKPWEEAESFREDGVRDTSEAARTAGELAIARRNSTPPTQTAASPSPKGHGAIGSLAS
jgi:hypothetical protein